MRAGLGVCLLISLGCAGQSAPPGSWEGDADGAVAKLCEDAPKNDGPLSAEAAKLRRRGIEALGEGQLGDARRSFDEALEEAPNNVALAALRAAADDALRQSGEDATKALDRLTPMKMKPAAATPTGKQAPSAHVVRHLRMSAEGLHERMGVPDLRPLDVTAEPQIPKALRRRYGLTAAFAHPDHGILIYTTTQSSYVVMVEGERLSVADFSPYADPKVKTSSARVSHAAVRGSILYATVLTDGGESFIAAHDRRDGKRLWKISSMSTSANFVLSGDYLVAVRNDNQLVVLDRHTGREMSRQPLSGQPSYLAHKDGIVFARFWSPEEVEVFQLGSRSDALNAMMSKPKPKGRYRDDRARVFAFPSPSFTAIAARHSCAVDRAVRELDAGSYQLASAHLATLERVYPHQPMVVALSVASRHMQQELEEPGAVDLSRAKIRELEAWAAPLQLQRKDGERSITKVVSGPVEDVTIWAQDHGVERYTLQPDDLPPGIPRSFGTHAITEWAPSDGGHVAVYGRRFVAAMRAGKADAVFDCSSLSETSSSQPNRNASFGVHYAARRDGSLFVSWTDDRGGGGVAAIDVVSGRVRWRAASPMQAVNFVVTDEYVVAVAGSGLLLLRRADGALLDDEPLDAVPRAMTASGNRVLMNLNTSTQEFEIGPSVGEVRRPLPWNGASFGGG